MAEKEECGFRINKQYAQNYNRWREKEELQKLKDKYGDADEESSSSESEDSDAEVLTEQLEKDWLRTLAALKAKDPRIYDKNTKFYHSEDDDDSSSSKSEEKKKKKEKPMYLKDYERKIILEKEGKLSEEEEDSDAEETKRRAEPGYYEEQEQIRKGFKAALQDSDSEGEDDFLKERKKTQDEKDHEEKEYLDWLKGKKEELGEAAEELKPLKEYWTDPKLEEGEKFLRDYILNKKYLDKDDDDRIPTYEEIVEDEDFSEEEAQLEMEEQFERKYNFRFEEPDPEFIKSYPRTLSETVRRKDDRRPRKRQEIKERKLQEKEKKREELKQLKNLKKREIFGKLDHLKEVTGNKDLAFTAEDLDEDFDPANYDKLMKKMFDQQYYDNDVDDVKPVFPDDDEELGLEGENWDAWQRTEEGEDPSWQDTEYDIPDCEHPDFNMDADYDPSQPKTLEVESKKKKKKKKTKLAEALEKQKPVFDPVDKTYEEYIEEYYKLDYEDMIGDTPCRFKYRNVVPNDFSLSTQELLSCPDRELNAWASIKKMSQYRTTEEEQLDVRLFRKKGRNMQKKINVLPSLKEQEKLAKDVEDPEVKKGKKRMAKGSPKQQQQQPKKAKLWDEEEEEEEDILRVKPTDQKEESAGHIQPNIETINIHQKKKKNKSGSAKKGQGSQIHAARDPGGLSKNVHEMSKKEKKKKKLNKDSAISDERLKAYGINPKKFRHLQKQKKRNR